MIIHVGDWIARADSFTGQGYPKNPGLVTGVKWAPHDGHTLSVFWSESRYAADLPVEMSTDGDGNAVIIGQDWGTHFLQVPVSIVRHKI